MHEYPSSFARFYDLIYHSQRDSVDNEFFQREIKKTKGKILEAGGGTGRLFINALQQGADIYGLDISPSMIGMLREKLNPEQRHRISIQNIVDFHYDFQFDLAIAPFRVMMHLLQKEEQMSALDNVYRHLNPGGRFIFDAFVPDPQLLKSGYDRFIDFDGEYAPGKKLKRVISSKPDLVNQIIRTEFHLEWDENGNTQSEDWSLPLRIFFRFELEHLVERSLFEKYSILGDYQGNDLTDKSKDFIVVCVKK